MKTDKLYYGAAYYEEYLPYDRIDKDFMMMNRAGINIIRIGESTWSTWEPVEGEFDFSLLKHMLDKALEYDLSVIVGTPTYAIPSWMAKKYPDILALTHNGQGLYGHRQNMDITNPDYLRHCEIIIRKMMEVIKDYKNVIGIQIDNETKPYDTCTKYAQDKFVKYMQGMYKDIEEMNREFGFNYWSNSIHRWEDFPDVRGTINGSLSAEYKYFQRTLVTDFFEWQKSIIREYIKDNVFITHNFDFGWKGFSFGLQPEVNQHDAAKSLDVVGCDIYHPTRNSLTGREISFCGAIAYSLKKDNYLVLETEAQGFAEWTPYEGQLRLQAYSHLAGGANSVMYWHWFSLHNAIETYWKGVLSHDFSENAVYKEACIVGNEFKKYGDKLKNLKIKSDVAILLSNRALSGIDEFPIFGGLTYNDIVRKFYDCFYDINIFCDVLDSKDKESFKNYKLIICPALYSATEEELNALKEYVKEGGTLVTGFKTGFSDEHLKVYYDTQPHILNEVIGAHYDQFTVPDGVCADNKELSNFMELLSKDSADVIYPYENKHYDKYAAVTKNKYNDGFAYYVATNLADKTLTKVLKMALESAKIDLPNVTFPVVIKSGINDYQKRITYIFNYSDEDVTLNKGIVRGHEILTDKVYNGESVTIPMWSFLVLEEI